MTFEVTEEERVAIKLAVETRVQELAAAGGGREYEAGYTGVPFDRHQMMREEYLALRAVIDRGGLGR